MQDFSRAYLNKNIIQCKNNLEDERLLELLKENNTYAWQCVYDKYAPLMYGNILNIVKDKVNAEKIFINAFTVLKNQNKQIPSHCLMSVFLCMYAKKYARENFVAPLLPTL